MYSFNVIFTLAAALMANVSLAQDVSGLEGSVEGAMLDQRSAAAFRCPKSLKREGCLTREDMDSILSRWPMTFDGNYTGDALKRLITCTVSSDFKQYDKTFTFGDPDATGLLTQSRKEFIQQQQGTYDNRKYSATKPGGAFSRVFAFHSCNQIAFRFRFDGKTSGKTKCTSTANTTPNIPIKYFGTDLLTIKPGTILIEEAVTSADYINDFLPIGANFNGSSLCPGTVPQACDADCGPCAMQRRVHF